ncbi:hypothetical protein [Streptomyces sp. NPDC057426]|uniref:hypothetical protein n=1 Tax=Streptomyces sp. NPDC057426 TaxID=3346128 RepID=UPI0036AA62CD
MNEKKFADMASQFLRASLDSWRAGSHAFAVLHAGVGCEHILKALLCRYNPLLISEKGDQSLRFHSLGFGNAQGVKPLSEARTIGIVEAFKTATIFMGGRMPVDERAFRPFADSRNGVAHSAYLDDQAAGEVVELGLLVVEAVRAELGLDPADFWGEYEPVFSDLAKVAAMPAPAGRADRPAIEAAAEELALAERGAARAVLSAAATTAVEVASWGSATRPDNHQEDIARTALHAVLVTGLRTAGARARQAAAELLTEYEVLPFPSRPDASHDVAGITQKAHTAVAVKVLISSSVIAGLHDIHYNYPAVPIIPSLVQLNESGWLRNNQASSGDHAWWRHCPACGYDGNVYGDLDAAECSCPEWDEECPHPDGTIDVGIIESFSCPFCGLLLSHGEELAAAGIESGEI